jgi:hypothetical protein
MRPAQFERHCLPNRKHQIKATHIAQVGGIKALAEFRRQLFREHLQLALAVGSTDLPLLFMFDNEPADVTVAVHHCTVYGQLHLLPRLLDKGGDIAKKRSQFLGNRWWGV